MNRWCRGSLVSFIAFVLSLAAVQSVSAAGSARWSDQQLSAFSEVVLTGRVLEVNAGWDPAVHTIYTYVTLDVTEVLKGAVLQRRVTIKQMGGVVDGMGLAVADQATFAVGEDVLLFLEVRPRDGTLYTTALSQGKWTLESSFGGSRSAVRAGVGSGAIRDRRAFDDLRSVAAEARAHVAMAQIQADPPEATVAAAQPFSFVQPLPRRFLFSPAVDVQTSGQPGLSGGGFTEIVQAIGRWNAAGSPFQFQVGGTIAPRCSTPFIDRRISISFNDPCREISDSGGTLALTGGYHDGTSSTVNGQQFTNYISGYVITNDSPTALTFLTQSGCFHDIMLHELGHVLGLGDSADPDAIMFASIHTGPTGCASRQRGLAQDDRTGLFAIYPAGSGRPPGTPTGVLAGPSFPDDGFLNVVWTAPGGSPAPTGYQLDFFSGNARVAIILVGANTSTRLAIPTGTRGTFTVTVTALANGTPGSPSAPGAFTIGGPSPGPGPGPAPPPPPCTAPPATPTGLTGRISGGVAAVSFTPSAGATSYTVQAGTSQGASNLFNANIGNQTSASAPVPAGFQAFVRVFANNACGSSAPTADFVLGLTLGQGDLQVTLSWNTATDIDLHIIEPDGTHVYYAARDGATARLDLDDTDGFGPENIFVNAGGASSGTYQVFIVHYAGSVPSTSQIQVRVNAGTVNERHAVFTRSTSTGDPSVGFNVADVNIGARTITERTGTRAADQREDAVVIKTGKR